jgi:hypothetical protein
MNKQYVSKMERDELPVLCQGMIHPGLTDLWSGIYRVQGALRAAGGVYRPSGRIIIVPARLKVEYRIALIII